MSLLVVRDSMVVLSIVACDVHRVGANCWSAGYSCSSGRCEDCDVPSQKDCAIIMSSKGSTSFQYPMLKYRGNILRL